MKYRCYNIQWDLSDVPEQLELGYEPPVFQDEYLFDCEDEEQLNDLLSDETGWLHNGFDYEEYQTNEKKAEVVAEWSELDKIEAREPS